MATLYAKAAGGNWTDAATWSTVSSLGVDSSGPPTAADDVIFSAGSGNVTIDAAAVCRSADFSGGGVSNYTGTLTHTSAITLSIGDGTAGTGNKALTLVSAMTYAPGASTQAISFVSTSATVQAIDTGGKTTGNLTFNGVGGSWQLAANLTARTDATITLTNGTLDTNGKAVSALAISSNNSNTRVLTLGASVITLSGTSTSTWNFTTVTGLTFTPGTSTITFTGNAGTGTTIMQSGSLTYATVTFTGAGIPFIAGVPTFGTLTRTGTAAKTDGLGFSGNATVTGTFTATGNSAINRLWVESSAPGTARTVTAAVVSLTNVDFTDITGAGVAAPFTGTSMGNALGNTSITFDTPVAQTHTTSAGGNWSDVTKWTSRIPLPQDNVIVDANTSGTLTADMPRLGANLTFTGFVGTAAFSSTPNIGYGNLTLGTGMTISGTQTLTLSGRSAQTLTSNSVAFTQALSFNGPSGTYTLQDALSTAGAITVVASTGATLNTNSVAVTTSSVTAQTGTTLAAGTTTFTLTSTASTSVWSTSTTATQTGTPSLTISTTSANNRIIAGGGKTYGTLTYTVANSTGSLSITNASNTFAAINFSDTTSERALILPSATTTTVTTFSVNGTLGIPMAVTASTAASAATLALPVGTTTCNYVVFKDITVTGGTITAVNGQLVSGTTGITVSYSRTATTARTEVSAGTPRMPARGLFLPGVTSNYASTPSSSALQITGDIDLRWYGYLTNWASPTIQVLMGKQADGTHRSWGWRINAKNVDFFISADGTATTLATSTSAITTVVQNGQPTWIRVTWAQGTQVVTFYTSVDGVTWTQLGNTASIAVASISVQSTAKLEVGAISNGLTSPMGGMTLYAEVRNGIAGTVVANPDFTTNVSSGFSDSSGNVWTINGSGVTTAQLISRQPLNYLFLPGKASNYASAPDSVALSITGDIDIRAYVAMDTYRPAAAVRVMAKDKAGGSNSWIFSVNSSGSLGWTASADGGSGTAVSSGTAILVNARTAVWLRVTWRASDGRTQFFTSSDGSTWAQNGTDQTANVGSINDNDSPVELGARILGTADTWPGKFFYAEIRNGIAGTIVASPDFTSATASGFSDAQGNVWTVNTSGTLPAALVSRTSV